MLPFKRELFFWRIYVEEKAGLKNAAGWLSAESYRL